MGTVNENTVGTATPHEPSQELTAEDANSGHDEQIPNSISSITLPSVEVSAESSLISSITKATIFAGLVASLLSLHSDSSLTKSLFGPVSGTSLPCKLNLQVYYRVLYKVIPSTRGSQLPSIICGPTIAGAHE